MNSRWLLLGLAVSILMYSCSTSRGTYMAGNNRSRDSIQEVSRKNAGLNPGERGTADAKGMDSMGHGSNVLVKKYSALMNVEQDQLTNIELLHFVDAWYGVPYKYGGKTKKGIDCSDFACTLLNEVYGVQTEGSSKDLKTQCSPVKKPALKEGDLVFFKIRKGHISHVGVYITNGYFIHASTKAGVVISNLEEDYYKRYYSSAGRIPNKRITRS